MDGKTLISGISIVMLSMIAIAGIIKGSDGILNILVGAICTITGASVGITISNKTQENKTNKVS